MKIVRVSIPSKRNRRFIKDVFIACWIGFVFWMILLNESMKSYKIEASELVENQTTDTLEEMNTPIQTLETMKVQEIKGEGWRVYLESLNEPQELKDWISRVVQCESRGDPLAENKQEIIIDGISYGKAQGLLQIIPSTWTRFGCEGSVFDEYKAIDCGVKAYKMGRQSEWMCH